MCHAWGREEPSGLGQYISIDEQVGGMISVHQRVPLVFTNTAVLGVDVA
jgi:hypothetical protein